MPNYSNNQKRVYNSKEKTIGRTFFRRPLLRNKEMPEDGVRYAEMLCATSILQDSTEDWMENCPGERPCPEDEEYAGGSVQDGICSRGSTPNKASDKDGDEDRARVQHCAEATSITWEGKSD